MHIDADKILLASDRDERCRKTSKDITRSRRHAPIGRPRPILSSGFGVNINKGGGIPLNINEGKTEQCRKTAIGNARRCRQDLIGREGYAKGATEH